jgi:hypothetical protein
LISSASIAKNKRSVKSSKAEVSSASVQRISDILKKILAGPSFPALKVIPNIHYIFMALCGLEVNDFKLLRKKGGVVTSRHITPSPLSSFVYKGYLTSPNYLAVHNRLDISTDQKYNLDDGIYPHGLTAVMGCWFIRDTNANKELAPYKALINSYAAKGIPLEINIMESMTSLFIAEDDNAIEASLVQGLIILNLHYLRARASKKYSSIKDPFAALLIAVGLYVGTGRDANGYTGVDRIIDVQNLKNSKLKILADNNILPEEDSYFNSTTKIIVATAFNRKGHPSGQSITTTTPTRVAQNTTVTPEKPNC